MRTFPHVFEPDGKLILTSDFHMKGAWRENFFGNQSPLILELGCGRGEYSVELAKRHPERNYIGIDIKGARMWKGAREALDAGITNVAFLRTRIEFLHRMFGPEEVDEIWVTFPDPQPQKPRKRLTSARFLNLYSGFLKPGGLVHLKTDSLIMFDYMRQVLELNSIVPDISTGSLYESGIADEILSIRTHYESGYLRTGKPITYTRFRLPGGMRLKEPADLKE
jgi:tRNA (guanine-N7-)-methyltransferase